MSLFSKVGLGLGSAALAGYFLAPSSATVKDLKYQVGGVNGLRKEGGNNSLDKLVKQIDRLPSWADYSLTARLSRGNLFQRLIGREDYGTTLSLSNDKFRTTQSPIESDLDNVVNKAKGQRQIECLQSCSTQAEFSQCVKKIDTTRLIEEQVAFHSRCHDEYCCGAPGCPNLAQNIYGDLLGRVKCSDKSPHCLELRAALEKASAEQIRWRESQGLATEPGVRAVLW
jgi:hypothetical protein